MEIFNSSNIPDLKEGETIVPLFTLDTFLLPEDQMMMRVFEPRYKQMLDDIVLDGLPYGHVISNLSMPELNGVSVPYDVGVLVEINQFQEQGSNLLYLANGGKRFRIIHLLNQPWSQNFSIVYFHQSMNWLENISMSIQKGNYTLEELWRLYQNS